jgi:mRNA-degrading endonuclease RelE of RelBE toxin-antitoxin system
VTIPGRPVKHWAVNMRASGDTRVGDYRIIAKIEDGMLRILIVEVGNRKNVYR